MNQEQSIAYAKKYLEDLLTFFEINVEVMAQYTDEVIELSVPSTSLNSLLIGRNAETLRSMQYLVSTILRNKEAAITRVNVDVADYKKQRAEKLAQQTREWVAEVRQSGDSKVLHLNAADRRIVHRVAGEFPDIFTTSEGEGKERRIIIAQASS